MGELLFFDRHSGGKSKPSLIQVGAVGNAFGTPHTSGVMEILHSHKLLEKEFKKDGIAVIWSFLVGTGPAVNEGLADGSVDFACYGDLSAVLGKAGGVRSTVLACAYRGANNYIAVRTKSRSRAFLDLKGQKIGFRKGTNSHLQFEKLLDRHGLVEKDFETFNLGVAEGSASLLAGQIDAYVGSAYFLSLQEQGLVRIIYDNRKEDQRFKGGGVLVGREDFVRRHPDIARRLVKVYVRAAHWVSNEKNRRNFLDLSTMKGISYPALEIDHEGDSLKWRKNPLMDDFFFRYYASTVAFAKRRGLIEKAFDTAQWADKRFIESALKDLGLENYWNDPASGAASGRKEKAGGG